MFISMESTTDTGSTKRPLEQVFSYQTVFHIVINYEQEPGCCNIIYIWEREREREREIDKQGNVKESQCYNILVLKNHHQD